MPSENNSGRLYGESGPGVLNDSRASLPGQRRRTGVYRCVAITMLEGEVEHTKNRLTHLDCLCLDRSKREKIYGVFQERNVKILNWRKYVKNL